MDITDSFETMMVITVEPSLENFRTNIPNSCRYVLYFSLYLKNDYQGLIQRGGEGGIPILKNKTK